MPFNKGIRIPISLILFTSKSYESEKRSSHEKHSDQGSSQTFPVAPKLAESGCNTVLQYKSTMPLFYIPP